MSTYNAERHGRHADLHVGRRGGGGGGSGRLAQPALDGEDDGRPADHFVAGEDLKGRAAMISKWERRAGWMEGVSLKEDGWVGVFFFLGADTYGGHGESGGDGALEVLRFFVVGTFGVGND